MLAEVLHKSKEMVERKQAKYRPRPSLAGPERCIRALDYYAQGYEPKSLGGRALTVLDDSSWHEQLVLDEIRKTAYSVHSEQLAVNIPAPGLNPDKYFCFQCKNYVPPNHIHAHIDGIITDILQKDRILEIKALNHIGFNRIWDGEELPMDYIYQSVLYVRGFGEFSVDEALLFVKNKNQAQYIDLLIQYEKNSDTAFVKEMTLSTGEKKDIGLEIPKIFENTVARFLEIDQYACEKKLHDRQYPMNSWRCGYCQYYETCWEGWEEEVKSLPETITLGNEFILKCEKLIEHKSQLKALEKMIEAEENELKNSIRGKGRKAIAGDYVFGIRPQERSFVDHKLIDQTLVRAATVTKTIEVFESPRKIKERMVKKDETL